MDKVETLGRHGTKDLGDDGMDLKCPGKTNICILCWHDCDWKKSPYCEVCHPIVWNHGGEPPYEFPEGFEDLIEARRLMSQEMRQSSTIS
jgi:hypothetical protein